MKFTFVFLFGFFFFPSLYGQFWKVSELEKLGSEINSPAEESIPVFHPTRSELYFVRTFDRANRGDENDQDIWLSEVNASIYTPAKSLSALNNKLNNAVLGFSHDGNRIYLLDAYGGKKDLVKGISFSSFENNSWGTPEELKIPELSIQGSFYGFHINKSEDVIVLSYNGPASLGEEDLYISVKENGNWSAPQHLGNKINTNGFEISPFLSDSGDTLYFSSNGLGGEGDADIFYSIKGANWTDWSKPKNLGKPFNSHGFDAYFTLNNGRAYWSSNQDAEESDIYTAMILYPPPLKAVCTTIDLSSYNAMDGSCEVELTSAAEPVSYTWSNGQNGNRIENLSAGMYTVLITDDAAQQLKLECLVTGPAQPLNPVVVKEFDNKDWIYYFGYNKNKLGIGTRSLKKYLNEIEEQLKEGRSNVTIKIRSSASHVPTKSFPSNEELAQSRAENIKYDLLDYFSKTNYKSAVNVVIISTIVDGPAYENDGVRKKKYEPFQFVSLATE
jgi:hypothetical protein